MAYTIGIDIGGSTTKIVGMSDGKILSPLMVNAGDPLTSAYGAFGRFLTGNGLSISDVTKIMCTGVGSAFLKEDIYSIPTHRVDEFIAFGTGGRYISGVDNCIVASMGTGTAFASVKGSDITHVGGTGVGGGTVLGLCESMFGVHTFEHIVELAMQGDTANVDLTIGDITSNKLSNMKDSTTASNFGKMSDTATHADLAAGVLNMVFQTIGIFAAMAARASDMNTIVLTGNLSTISLARATMDALEKLYSMKYIIPENSDFATAIGAAICGK